MNGMDEHARQRELDTYRIVDTLPEHAYDDIVKIASIVCQAPVALVSLVDRDRQWFKASTGLNLRQTPRNEAVCNHAIRTPDRIFEVRDLASDPRFADLPIVTGAEPLFFYAGMPLVTPNGAPIGTVCVLDREPRQLSEPQREALASLARLTMNLLDARQRDIAREREQALAAASAVPVPEPAQAAPAAFHADEYIVAIFELQDYAGAAARLGDRALEKALVKLDGVLESEARCSRANSINRAAGSAETVAVLRGPERAQTLARLESAAHAFEQETGLVVLSAHADTTSAHESIGELFLRADEALSAVKDARMRAA